MIARPFHTANEGLVAVDVTLPEVEGVDLGGTVNRIGDWGGDPRLYAFLLTAALSTGAVRDYSTARTLGVIAGWRSGVVALRDDALGHAAEGQRDGVAAALGLLPSEVSAFLSAQAADPFAWPAGARLVARVGGFSGFGQAWTAPPTDARFTAPSVIEVTCGAEHWAIHADVFGARLGRIDERSQAIDSRVMATTSADSYLVAISRSWLT